MFTVIVGPPAGGKSTYVSEHASESAVVVDFDALAVALGSGRGHDHRPQHTSVAQAAWLAAKSAALNSGADVWLIHANPSRQSLAIYRKQGARVVAVDPGESVVRERMAARPGASLSNVDSWYSRGW